MLMLAVFLLLTSLQGAYPQQEQSVVFESAGSEFFVGFVRVPRNRYYNDTEIRLHVTTNEQNPVTFTVSAPHSDFNVTAVATNHDSTVVVLPDSLEVESGNLTDRNKGIHVKSEGDKKITVYGSSTNRRSVDYFLAFPCTDLGLDEYKYYGINFTSRYFVNSVLIVACEDNTVVTTPFTTLVLNRLQTYWYEIETTAKISTSKPVSFFNNGFYEDCYNNIVYCGIFIEQQSPTAIWGNTFITARILPSPRYMVIATHNSTNITVNCTTYSEPKFYYLEEGGNWINTVDFSYDYCFIQSSSPVLVIQSHTTSFYETSYTFLELPVTQYSNNYLLINDHGADYSYAEYVHLFVEPEYYQPERIVVEAFNESNHLVVRESNFTWTPIYCHQSEVCGYAVRIYVTYWTRRYEVKFRHEDSVAKLGLLAFGFDHHPFTLSYVYLGGICLYAPGSVNLSVDCYPQTRTLACSVSGSLISSIVWRRNGVILSIDGINYQQNQVRVDENITENRLSVLRSNTFLGNFTCTATQFYASSAYILISPNISVLSAEVTNVTESGIINITCSARVPVPMTLTWLRVHTSNNTINMAILNPSSRVSITAQSQVLEDVSLTSGSCENTYRITSSLVIHNAVQSDGVMYICQAGNGVTRNIIINVHPIDNCTDTSCRNGGQCIDLFQDFHCNCTGTNHVGRYCEVEIRSTEKPNVTNVNTGAEPRLLMPVNLTCDTDGCLEQSCSYHWYRDGARIEGEFRSYLYVEQFSPEHRGYYTCEANNSYGSDTSDSNLLTLQGIRQYLVMVNYSQSGNTHSNNIEELRAQISSILLSSEGFNNSAVGYGITQQNTTSTDSILTIPVLLTLNISNTTSGDQIQQAIRQKLQLAFTSASFLSVDVIRFDGCPAMSNEPIETRFPNITYSWPETEIGSYIPYSCTCRNILQLEQNDTDSQNIGSRKCGGSYRVGAIWEPVNIVEDCGLSSITLQLCQTLIVSNSNPEILSETLADTTSNSEEIKAVDISVATTLLERLNTVAITLEEENVTENFLTTIDNLILANPEEIAQSQENSRSSSRLLNVLTGFADNVQVSNTTNSTTFVQRSYALHVANIDTSNFMGETLTIEINNNEQRNSTIDPSAIVTMPGTEQNVSETVTAAVRTPMSIFQELGLNNSEMQRLSYTLITEDSLFKSSNRSQENLTLVSAVVSVRVNGSENYESKLEYPIEVFLQVIQNSANISCGLWDPKRNDGLGAWSMDSCEILMENTTTLTVDDECLAQNQKMLLRARYSQPGHFGLLLDVTYQIVEPTPYTFALEVITYVGLPVSLICLTIFLITYITTKKLRNSGHGQILINVSIALMCLYIMFLIGAHAAPVPPICGISAALLQYFMLVFFGWTAVEAFYLYRKLVKVLGTHMPKFVLKAALIVWLAPWILVILLAGPLNSYYYLHNMSPTPCNVTANETSNSTLNNRPSGFCCAVGPPFWVGTVVPFVAIYLFNWVVFILIMVSLYRHTQKKLEKDEKEDKIKFVKQQVTIGFGLATLFGLGWGFGLAASSTTVDGISLAFQSIFSVFVAFQGVLFFVLHGIKKQEARNQWKLWFAMITTKPLNLYSVSKVGSKATHSTYNMCTLPKGSTFPRKIKKDLNSAMVSQTPNPTRKVSLALDDGGQLGKQWSSAPELDKMDDCDAGEQLTWKYTGVRWERVAEKSLSRDLDNSELVITNIDTVEGDD